MKILWAVDVFESHPKAVKSMSRFLKSLHSHTPLKVDVVSVIFPSETPSASGKREFQKLLEERLGGARRQKWFNDSHILFESQIPQRVAVMDLIEFAQKGNYDAIVAVKHSKFGKKRAYLGSFAEMLAFLSPISLFLVNPDGETPSQIRRLLLATDASPEYVRDFGKLSKFIPLKGISIHLHYRIPFVFPSRTTPRDQELYRKSETNRATECLARVEELAYRLGSTTEKTIRQESGTTEDTILRSALKQKSDLIVLTHKRKGAIGFFLGRITRRVLQNTDRPVLLFRV